MTTTHNNENKAIVTAGAIISSRRVLIFLFLDEVVGEVVGQMGSPNMAAAVSHNPLLPCRDTLVEFLNIPPVGIGPSNLLFDISM